MVRASLLLIVAVQKTRDAAPEHIRALGELTVLGFFLTLRASTWHGIRARIALV